MPKIRTILEVGPGLDPLFPFYAPNDRHILLDNRFNVGPFDYEFHNTPGMPKWAHDRVRNLNWKEFPAKAPKKIEIARSKLKLSNNVVFIQGKAQAIPLKARMADETHAINVLHLISKRSELKKAVKEMARVTKDKIVVTCATHGFEHEADGASWLKLKATTIKNAFPTSFKVEVHESRDVARKAFKSVYSHGQSFESDGSFVIIATRTKKKKV